MEIKYENGHFEFDDEFKKMLELVTQMQKEQFKIAKSQVQYIIKNNIKDKKIIEETLDLLFELLEDEEALLLYRRLCRHYWFIDKEATTDYISFYIEQYDPEHKKFGNNKNNDKDIERDEL